MTRVDDLIADLRAGRIRYAPEIQQSLRPHYAPEIQQSVRPQELTEVNFPSQKYILHAGKEPLDATKLPTEIVARGKDATYKHSVTEKSKKTKKENARDLKHRVKKIHQQVRALYAQFTESVLVLLEGDNADGKDGMLRHVFKLNPATTSGSKAFKSASPEQRLHEPNWRFMNHLPGPGQIGFHNRSAYGDVVFACDTDAERVGREADIKEMEYGLIMGLPMTPEGHIALPDATGQVAPSAIQRPPMRIVKVFLNICKAEQAERLADRLLDKTKLYKASQADIDGHEAHEAVQTSFANAMASTSTAWCPTYIIPNDNKRTGWRKLAQIISKILDDMDCQHPPYDGDLDLAGRKEVARPLLAEVERARR